MEKTVYDPVRKKFYPAAKPRKAQPGKITILDPERFEMLVRAAKEAQARYDEAAVDKAIQASRQKIGGREAKLIKALLQGRAA